MLDKHTKADLREFLAVCRQFVPDLDEEQTYAMALAGVRRANGTLAATDPSVQPLADLERRWYASLEASGRMSGSPLLGTEGDPDYAVYGDPAFLSELWACWVVYSRQYLRTIESPKSMVNQSIRDHIGPVSRVVDLGCGAGYTTAALGKMFNAEAVGTNVEGTSQYEIASEFGRREGFRLVPSVQSISGGADLVFASEYFEHLEAPIEHLREVLDVLQPRALLVANAFSSPAIGHFPFYRDASSLFGISGKEIGRMFGKVLRQHGYKTVETKCWNNRPMYWRKEAP